MGIRDVIAMFHDFPIEFLSFTFSPFGKRGKKSRMVLNYGMRFKTLRQLTKVLDVVKFDPYKKMIFAGPLMLLYIPTASYSHHTSSRGCVVDVENVIKVIQSVQNQMKQQRNEKQVPNVSLFVYIFSVCVASCLRYRLPGILCSGMRVGSGMSWFGAAGSSPATQLLAASYGQ